MKRFIIIVFLLCPFVFLGNSLFVGESIRVDVQCDKYVLDTVYCNTYQEKKDTVIDNIYVNSSLSCYNNKVLYYRYASDRLNSSLKKLTNRISETENHIALRGSLIKPNLLDIGNLECEGGYEKIIESLSNKLKHRIVSGFTHSKLDSLVVFVDISIGNKHSVLYETKYRNDKWTKCEKLSFCKKGIDYGMPKFSKDGKTLFFASNDKSGYGGWDIYYVQRADNESWQKPRNVGSIINTKGNELNPYISYDNYIYFSSNGRAGVGGYDIYKYNMNETYGVIQNLARPINTINDEMSIVVTNDSDKICVLTCKDDEDKDINILRVLEKRSERNTDTISKKIIPSLVSVTRDNVPTVLVEPNKTSKKISNERTIYFSFDKYILMEDELSKIDNIMAQSFKDNTFIEIVGYASTAGGELYNLLLAQQRANEVMKYILKFHSVEKSRISVLASGEYVSGCDGDSQKVDIILSSSLNKKKRTYYRLPYDMSRKDLANLFNVSSSEIDDFNGNISELLKEGALVIIPITEIYRMQAGDSINKIAKRFKVNLGQLRLINSRLKNVVEGVIIIPNRNKLI